jgi:hypothetical protein
VTKVLIRMQSGHIINWDCLNEHDEKCLLQGVGRQGVLNINDINGSVVAINIAAIESVTIGEGRYSSP